MLLVGAIVRRGVLVRFRAMMTSMAVSTVGLPLGLGP